MTTLMRSWGSACHASLLVFSAPVRAPAGDAVDEPPWQKPYTGEEATGENVIALWQFNPGEEAKDNSGNGHDLSLRGQARFVENGRFASCLESFPADQENDKPQGASAKNHPGLSPEGPFTLEMWFQPKPEMDDFATVFLLDKKYFHYAKDLPEAHPVRGPLPRSRPGPLFPRRPPGRPDDPRGARSDHARRLCPRPRRPLWQ